MVQPAQQGTRRRMHGDRGMVTAETAMVLPALVVLVCVAVGAVAVATAQLRCVDAAREAARAAARGEGASAARTLAIQAAPRAARVTVSLVGDRAEVTVTATVRPLGRLLPAVSVRARAVAVREPGWSARSARFTRPARLDRSVPATRSGASIRPGPVGPSDRPLRSGRSGRSGRS
jgi:TadE-like protein.